MNEKIKIGVIVFGNMFLMGVLLLDIAIYLKFEGTSMYYLLVLVGAMIAVYFVAYTTLNQLSTIRTKSKVI